ncbi:MAG: DUF533 domain-containing protein, partial [Ramlibacter sp.]
MSAGITVSAVLSCGSAAGALSDINAEHSGYYCASPARRKQEQTRMAQKPTEADWILRAMVAVAAADGRLDAREVGLI